LLYQGLYPRGVSTKIVYTFIALPIRDTCLVHLNLLGLVTLKVLVQEYWHMSEESGGAWMSLFQETLWFPPFWMVPETVKDQGWPETSRMTGYKT
jgi:hypothetical protein